MGGKEGRGKRGYLCGRQDIEKVDSPGEESGCMRSSCCKDTEMYAIKLLETQRSVSERDEKIPRAVELW